MTRDAADVSPAVLSDDARTSLGEYLRFRHLFRHRYGFELEWDRLLPLLMRLETVASSVRAELLAARVG